MGFFQGLFQLISLVFMFIGKCAEYVFVSIIFAVPIWFLYTKLFMVRFALPQLFYIDFIAITFCIQLVGMLWTISSFASRQQDNIPEKVMFLPTKNKEKEDNNNDL